MSANKFIDTPPAIIVWNPVEKKCVSAFVLPGDVPNAVYSAIEKDNSSVLKEYYGSEYKSKLLIDTNLDTLIPTGWTGSGGRTHERTRIEDGIEMMFGMDVAAANTANTTLSANILSTIAPTSSNVIQPLHTGGDDIDLDEIEELLSESVRADKQKATAVKVQGAINVQLPGGVSYIKDVSLYPEDRFDEVKNKIYLATGIPPYRQHIFYFANGQIQCIYKLYTDGINVIDIRGVNTLQLLHGLPIDKSIYDQREISKVEALDVFQTLETSLGLDNRIFVVDLGLFTNPKRTQLLELLRDTYQFELLYYGFILKYWPQLTLDCFRDYIADEMDLQHKYPDLAPDLITLRTLYKHERAIIDSNYRQMPKLHMLAESGAFGLAITQMIAQVNGSGVMLNIRNVFEYFHTSIEIPEIHAWIEHENKRYLLVKKHVQSEEIIFPSGNTMRSGITFAISLRGLSGDNARANKSSTLTEQSRYLFLNIWPSGRYHIKSVWNEEDEFGFDETTAVMKQYIDPIIVEINKLGYYAFISPGKLPPLAKAVITYQGLTVCLFWKLVMTESTYKIVKTLWEPYFRAQITRVRNVQQFDRYEFSLQKGMYQFDNNAIERIISASNNLTVNNYYAHLSNQQIKQKWDQNYSGRILRMSHRTADVRFELIDIREHEFRTAQVYILGFIYSAINNSEVKASINLQRDYTDVKKLRKLREQDPELFNLKKYGSKKVYSIVCQNQRQPIIYTEDELRSMPAGEKAKLTQYWNFTLQKPAWYGCPSRAYPHLSFMVGVHPRHYCLPCCNKKMREDDESRKVKINIACMRDHKWIEDSEGALSRHIMNYGKDIDVGRLSKLPQTSLKNLLHDTISKTTDRNVNDRTDTNLGYYLYGVAQHFPGVENMGIVYAISAALEKTPAAFIDGIISVLKGISIDTLMRGVLTEYFRNTKELIIVMKELFIEWKVIPSVRLPYWPEIFIELTQIVYGVSVITFIDSSGNGVGINLHVVENVKNAILSGQSPCIAIIKRENNYYPMFIINPDLYFRRLEINARVYSHDHNLTILIRSMIKPTTQKILRLNLQVIKDFCSEFGNSTKIVCKYINQHNLCYGVGLFANIEASTDRESTNKKPNIFVPIDYSTNLPDGIAMEKTPSDDCEFRLDNTIAVYKEITKYISKLGMSPLVITHLIYYNNVMIGGKTRIGTVYINAGSSSDILIEHCSYDFRDVNRAISDRSEPTPDGRSRIGAALYSNYRYQLFIIEFVNYLDKERNNELREKIYALITETNFKRDLAKFRKTLRELVPSSSDYSTIQSLVSEFYTRGLTKNVLKDNIANRAYEFDRITLSYLQSLPSDRTESELMKIASSFAVEGVPSNINEFPNIYLPCEESHAGYCSGKKIILTGMKEFVSILASDIKDELRVAYLLNNVWMDAVIDVFKFTKVSTEIISIYKLTE
jgi:hypothetical protein